MFSPWCSHWTSREGLFFLLFFCSSLAHVHQLLLKRLLLQDQFWYGWSFCGWSRSSTWFTFNARSPSARSVPGAWKQSQKLAQHFCVVWWNVTAWMCVSGGNIASELHPLTTTCSISHANKVSIRNQRIFFIQKWTDSTKLLVMNVKTAFSSTFQTVFVFCCKKKMFGQPLLDFRVIV